MTSRPTGDTLTKEPFKLCGHSDNLVRYACHLRNFMIVITV